LGTIMSAAILIVMIGMLMLRLGLLKRENVLVLNTLIINIAMPSLVFLAVWRSTFSLTLLKLPILANVSVFGCMAIAYAVSRFLKIPAASAGAFIIASGFGNTSFLGFPLIISIFGQENLVYGVFFDQFSTGLVGLSIGAGIAAHFGKKGHQSTRFDFFNILKFPPLWGLILGFLLNGISLPAFVVKALEYMSSLVVPLVMISLGLSLRPDKVGKSVGLVFVACLIKLIISPAIYMLAAKVLNLQGIPYQVGLMEASMPAMMTTLSFAIKYDLDAELAASIILISLLASTVTVPLILKLF